MTGCGATGISNDPMDVAIPIAIEFRNDETAQRWNWLSMLWEAEGRENFEMADDQLEADLVAMEITCTRRYLDT